MRDSASSPIVVTGVFHRERHMTEPHTISGNSPPRVIEGYELRMVVDILGSSRYAFSVFNEITLSGTVGNVYIIHLGNLFEIHHGLDKVVFIHPEGSRDVIQSRLYSESKHITSRQMRVDVEEYVGEEEVEALEL